MAKNQSSEVEGRRIPSSEHGCVAGDVRSRVPAAASTYSCTEEISEKRSCMQLLRNHAWAGKRGPAYCSLVGYKTTTCHPHLPMNVSTVSSVLAPFGGKVWKEFLKNPQACCWRRAGMYSGGGGPPDKNPPQSLPVLCLPSLCHPCLITPHQEIALPQRSAASIEIDLEVWKAWWEWDEAFESPKIRFFLSLQGHLGGSVG